MWDSSSYTAVDIGERATKIPFTAAADVFGIAAEVPAAAEILFLYYW
jgi:hypothetical protein